MKLSYKLLVSVTLWCGLSLLTMGCATTRPTTPTTVVTPSAACAVWPVISYTYPGDTAPTVRQVIASNAARKAYCP